MLLRQDTEPSKSHSGGLSPQYPKQGWTALVKPVGKTPWSRYGHRPRQSSPSVLLFELVLCSNLLGVGP